MICIASVLLILAVLVQSPKSGMAANFGAANQTMGVRQTTDFLEKFTWAMVAAVVFFTLLSVIALPSSSESMEATTTDAALAGAESILNPEPQTVTIDEFTTAPEADGVVGEETITIEAPATEVEAPATEVEAPATEE